LALIYIGAVKKPFGNGRPSLIRTVPFEAIGDGCLSLIGVTTVRTPFADGALELSAHPASMPAHLGQTASHLVDCRLGVAWNEALT